MTTYQQTREQWPPWDLITFPPSKWFTPHPTSQDTIKRRIHSKRRNFMLKHLGDKAKLLNLTIVILTLSNVWKVGRVFFILKPRKSSDIGSSYSSLFNLRLPHYWERSSFQLWTSKTASWKRTAPDSPPQRDSQKEPPGSNYITNDTIAKQLHQQT